MSDYDLVDALREKAEAVDARRARIAALLDRLYDRLRACPSDRHSARRHTALTEAYVSLTDRAMGYHQAINDLRTLIWRRAA